MIDLLDRAALAYWSTAPFWLCDTALGRWLLPYAGRRAYSIPECDREETQNDRT